MNYLKVFVVFVLAWGLNRVAPDVLKHLQELGGVETSIAESLWCMGLILWFGWACSKAAEGTMLPSFTLQLLVGIVLHDALSPLSLQLTLTVVLCTAMAAVILKSGGDEIDRKVFFQIAYPTLMLAIIGYGVTFLTMFGLLTWLGMDGQTAAVLAAITGATDPAALVPTLKQLKFKPDYQRLTHLSVAESALNDAVAAMMTAAVCLMVASGADLDGMADLARGLLTESNVTHLGQQFLFGTVAGLVGWIAMFGFERHKSGQGERGESDKPYDFAMVLAVPVVTFALATALHGNGFLAAFVAGLLANFNQGSHHFHGLLHSMEVKIESIAKPTIFMMVGPFVGPHHLLDTVWQGLGVSLLFIFVARPLAVWISLLPTGMGWREKMFLCAVRETGVIPVVLAVLAVAQFPDMHALMPLTAWVVIWTLTLLPAITPWWAQKLHLLE